MRVQAETALSRFHTAAVRRIERTVDFAYKFKRVQLPGPFSLPLYCTTAPPPKPLPTEEAFVHA